MQKIPASLETVDSEDDVSSRLGALQKDKLPLHTPACILTCGIRGAAGIVVVPLARSTDAAPTQHGRCRHAAPAPH